MDGGYKGWNPYIERHLAIFVNCFCLERTNQLSLLPDKDLVDLCPPIEPYQVTKNQNIEDALVKDKIIQILQSEDFKKNIGPGANTKTKLSNRIKNIQNGLLELLEK